MFRSKWHKQYVQYVMYISILMTEYLYDYHYNNLIVLCLKAASISGLIYTYSGRIKKLNKQYLIFNVLP